MSGARTPEPLVCDECGYQVEPDFDFNARCPACTTLAMFEPLGLSRWWNNGSEAER
jgi:hypothetical protein